MTSTVGTLNLLYVRIIANTCQALSDGSFPSRGSVAKIPHGLCNRPSPGFLPTALPPLLKALVQTDLGKDLVELIGGLLALGGEVGDLAAKNSQAVFLLIQLVCVTLQQSFFFRADRKSTRLN